MSAEGKFKERTDNKVREPGMYSVIMLNDDFTSMDFVVSILVDIFRKDEVTANTLMMTVHRSGSAVVGKYPYDIAVTKVSRAHSRAKEAGYPFRMSIKEV